MKKYAKIVNQDTKLCEVGLGDNAEFYQSIGMVEMEVEQSYDLGWYIVGYAPQKPLELYKQEKHTELQALKNAKLSEFSYKDKIYQIDESSKTNINGKISAILLSQNTEAPIQSVNWIAKDNTITQFSTAEFLAFSQAIASYIETILFKNDMLRTAINKAKSLEALNKINIDFGG